MPTPPLDLLTAILRRALFSLAPPDYTAILPLLRQAMAFLDREDRSSPATDGHLSDLASLTAAMIEESHSPGFIRAGLEILLRLGRVGESLAVSFAAKDVLPGEHLDAILGGLPGDEKLLLANAILRFPRDRRPELTRFAENALETAIDQDPDDILVLFDTLRLRQDAPSPIVRDACLHGRLGLWLARLVKMELYPEQVTFLSHMAAALRSDELAEPLLRAVPAHDAEAGVALCRAVAESPCVPGPDLAPGIEAMTASDDPRLVLAALAALSRLDPARAAQTAASLHASRPALRRALAAVPLFLPRPQFPAFVRALPEADRAGFLNRFLFFLARGGDEGLGGLVRQAQDAPEAGAGPAAALLDGLTRELGRAEAPVPPRPRRVRADPLPKAEAEGLLGRLKSLVGLDRDDAAEEKKPTALDGLAAGGELSGVALAGVARPGLVLRDVVFTKVNMECVDLSRGVLSRVVFRNCRLRKMDFTLARLAGVRFEACRLELCRFSGVAGSGLVFSGSDLFGVWLDDAEVTELRLSGSAANECTFFGSRLTRFESRRSLVSCGNFTAAVFSQARLLGTDMVDCTFSGTVFTDLTATGCHVRGTHFTGCAFITPQTDEPALLEARQRFQAARLLHLACSPDDAAPAAPDPGKTPLAARLAESWYFDLETRQRQMAVVAHNRRRLDWALEKLGDPDADFLRCLPSLMEVPRTWSSKGWIAATPGRIADHHPSFTAYAAMQNVMGEACPPHAPAKSAVTILGLFAMGSLGTVAQGQASDLDIWVCLADDDISRRMMDRFRKKLDGLRALAASRNIEAHFFVMTDTDIRENRLGLGDEEQCGHARAMLLKEEFLRTALFLAGRSPAWWLVTPGSDDETYARALARLSRPGAPAADAVLDTGNVSRLADEAFFGASLWTIVKSLENPFKSIMKFALLEKYLAGDGQQSLLCDRIKHRLFGGRASLFDTDPYVLLFDEVRAFHEARGNREALALLRLAFIQKTGIDPLDPGAAATRDQPGQNGGEGLFRAGHFFDLDECRAMRQTAEAAAPEADPGGGLAERMAAGKKIADFLSGTYERIRDRLTGRENASGRDVDERDLAMFGRRILSRFAARKNKIGRIPFVRPPRGLLHAVEIILDGPDQGYSARGECRRPDGRKVPEHIRSERSLERLAAWLTANDIYRPGVYLKAATVKAPLSFPDIQALFDALAATFPVKETFHPPLSEGLAPERVTRALIVLNLHVPREEKELEKAGIVYSTNWGELFFVENTQALHLLAEAPHDFVRYNTGLEVDPLARLETFIPAKAACPRLMPSFYA
jgi:adenylate cyclase class 1